MKSKSVFNVVIKDLGLITDLGLNLISPIIIFLGITIFISKYIHFDKTFFLIPIFLGLIIGFVLVFKRLKKYF